MFWNNKLFLLELVKNNGYNLRLIPDNFKNDREIVILAIINEGYA